LEKDLLLITPPFTQLNTPYPGTTYLKGFLNTKNISAYQVDLGIEVILNLFSKSTFENLFYVAHKNKHIKSNNAKRIYALKDAYLKTLNTVIKFLQGKNPNLARQICTDNFLPRASRFEQLDDLDYAFGTMGIQDKAKHLATLYLEDLSDFIIECIDSNFGFSRYAERLGMSANTFNDLHQSLQDTPTYIDKITLELLDKKIEQTNPKLVCFSVPFPGNLYAAFRCAKHIKAHYPSIKIAMGGGFPNTELRDLADTRVFSYFDFITLDDGELPTPDYSDLLLDQYISVIEIANPMHSLWSDGRWNKLTMAHGCYWGKCTFCDISLDYIKIYEPVAAKLLVDRMEELILQTNENGFHFVDEAAPPSLMKALALEIIKRELTVTWWTNIRFEKNFTQDLCFLLKASGCIAVSGGLEVASNRLLKLIDKGVTVSQVAQVTRNFTEANIMVHAYLMYGYPTQTIKETVDSLEMVRQLFELGILQSGFWHQFALTAHSPVGLEPESYNITPHKKDILFANNDIHFTDKTGINHEKFSFGLKKSLFNYMHGIGFDLPLQDWFDFKIPKTNIDPDFIYNCLETNIDFNIKPTSKIVWLGNTPNTRIFKKTKKGTSWELMELTFYSKTETFCITVNKNEGTWLVEQLEQISPKAETLTSYGNLKKDFEAHLENFELFWFSKPINTLRNHGLLVL